MGSVGLDVAVEESGRVVSGVGLHGLDGSCDVDVDVAVVVAIVLTGDGTPTI